MTEVTEIDIRFSYDSNGIIISSLGDNHIKLINGPFEVNFQLGKECDEKGLFTLETSTADYMLNNGFRNGDFSFVNEEGKQESYVYRPENEPNCMVVKIGSYYFKFVNEHDGSAPAVFSFGVANALKCEITI